MQARKMKAVLRISKITIDEIEYMLNNKTAPHSPTS